MRSRDDKFPKFDKKMFQEWMDAFFREPLYRMIEGKSFRVDLYETKKEWVIQAELPGFDKDQIEVQILPQAVKISANRQETYSYDDEDEQYYRRERSSESLERVIPVPYPIDPNHAHARYHKGLLTITVPKNGNQSHQSTIPIE